MNIYPILGSRVVHRRRRGRKRGSEDPFYPVSVDRSTLNNNNNKLIITINWLYILWNINVSLNGILGLWLGNSSYSSSSKVLIPLTPSYSNPLWDCVGHTPSRP